MSDDRPWDRWHDFADPDHPNPDIGDKVRVLYESTLPSIEREWEGAWPGRLPKIRVATLLRWRHLDVDTASRWLATRKATEAAYRQTHGGFLAPESAG